MTDWDTVGWITFLVCAGKDTVGLTTFSHEPHYIEGGSLRLISNVDQNYQTGPGDQEEVYKVRKNKTKQALWN